MIWTLDKDGVPQAPFPVFRLGAFWACETPEGRLAVFGRLPWGELPPLFTDLSYASIHYTAFRGWAQDLWHDGPQFIVKDGAVQSCVLPGTAAPLPAVGRADAAEFSRWLKEREVFAWKKSLAQAFRERLALPSGAFRLEGLQSHPTHALVLLGLRLAFPNTVFYGLDYPAEQKPQWKRYCQNLNLSTWASPRQLQGLEVLNLQDLARLWPGAQALTFLQQLNQRIPVVPGKLAALFTRP
ncbi:hypothetical protein [Oligoflexus tunisiensis]|uniref:hypothetical protein n=1 Tax=Oligoflexus tunisiensis TaxID=708132 RepID=UPI00114D3B7B|nr:hypothetical protein [Oligoflexus tunisiensis]